MVAQLVEALRYNTEGRGFDSRWCHWNSSFTLPFRPHCGLGLTQPLTEMSTSIISWGVKAAGAWGKQPYHLHLLIVLISGNLNLLETSGPVQTCKGIALLLQAHSVQQTAINRLRPVLQSETWSLRSGEIPGRTGLWQKTTPTTTTTVQFNSCLFMSRLKSQVALNCISVNLQEQATED